MAYVRATAVGVLAGLCAAGVWIQSAMHVPLNVMPLRPDSGGFLIALSGFVIGFWWTLRRSRRRTHSR